MICSNGFAAPAPAAAATSNATSTNSSSTAVGSTRIYRGHSFVRSESDGVQCDIYSYRFPLLELEGGKRDGQRGRLQYRPLPFVCFFLVFRYSSSILYW